MLGAELKAICARFKVTFIVNDDLELAHALDADGIHLGQDDGSPAEARATLGPGKIVGVSTHSLEEARAAQEAGADYVGYGAIYATDSKEVPTVRGPEEIAVIKRELGIPVVAIGGITRDNAGAVIDQGADAIAVISAVLSSRFPAVATTELALLFNRRLPHPRGTVLTVAGSDSGGGAGIQGDLKTITLLGSYGASAIAALTAQNSRGVSSIQPVASTFLAEQLEAVLSDLPIDVVKVGMLATPENAEVLADKLIAHRVRISIIDPVMSAKGGATLLRDDALAVMKKRLIPLCYLLTPNIPEAERLTGLSITDAAGMELAARALYLMGARNVLIKGGHQSEGVVTDLLFDGVGFTRYAAPRTLTRHTHGTGCALSSAIASFLAQGEPLPRAVLRAKQFITRAIKSAHPMGRGHGPVNHFVAVRDQDEE